MEEKQFAIGDRVRLITNRHWDDDWNPYTAKTEWVVKILNRRSYEWLNIVVDWDNGNHNNYAPRDLELLDNSEYLF